MMLSYSLRNVFRFHEDFIFHFFGRLFVYDIKLTAAIDNINARYKAVQPISKVCMKNSVSRASPSSYCWSFKESVDTKKYLVEKLEAVEVSKHEGKAF